jgi:hypothetical protein
MDEDLRTLDVADSSIQTSHLPLNNQKSCEQSSSIGEPAIVTIVEIRTNFSLTSDGSGEEQIEEHGMPVVARNMTGKYYDHDKSVSEEIPNKPNTTHHDDEHVDPIREEMEHYNVLET